MAILKILSYPDPRLKLKARKVEVFDEQLQRIIDDMFETHYNTKNCAALAATQLDIAAPPAVTVIDFSAEKNQPLCLVNAEIIEREGEQYEVEGCMSVYPDYIHGKVKRAARIKVRAQDRHGNPLEFTADDFMAKCIQHELDHLDGKLYIDRLSSVKRQLLESKINKAKRVSAAKP